MIHASTPIFPYANSPYQVTCTLHFQLISTPLVQFLCNTVRHKNGVGSYHKALERLSKPNKMIHASTPIFPYANSPYQVT
ncbi:hypothetical protein X801_08281, partial [Opisthorchis viverrini]